MLEMAERALPCQSFAGFGGSRGPARLESLSIRKLCSPITPNKPVRIASLQPSISIILDRLGRLDCLVACTRYCLAAVPVLRGRPLTIVRDSWSTSAEELLAVRPDLVIASVPYRNESLAAILKAGCPVLALAPHSLADIEQDIRLIGAVAHASDEAEEIIGGMRAELCDVRTASGRAAQQTAGLL